MGYQEKGFPQCRGTRRKYREERYYVLKKTSPFLFALLLVLGTLTAGAFMQPANAETVTVTETTEVTHLSRYDIWKHINGVWQFGVRPGSTIEETFSFSISLPDGAQVTGVTGAYNGTYRGIGDDFIVPSASVRVKSFSSTEITYTVRAALNGTPKDLHLPTQDPETEGYRYFIPVAFEVTYTVTREVPDPPPVVPTEPTEPVEPQLPEETVPDMSGDAVLVLPERTYEGHSVKALDESVFTVDGEFYSALQMYDEELASNRFSASGAGADARRDGKTAAKVGFTEPGTANVTLNITLKDKQRLQDVQSIDVLATPAIRAVLGGTQKQNRRQLISAEIAVNPAYPLAELWIEIEKKDGAERVHLDCDLTGGQNRLDNSALIKTRPLKDVSTDRQFQRVELEFLTKNQSKEQMTYRIYARDTRGHEDRLTAEFTVMPDRAPSVVIDAAPEQLRGEKSNIAQVTAEDATEYDGDAAERAWYVREEGEREWRPAGVSTASGGALQDASFGTWKSVVYEKHGVGKLELRLDVTDLWTEDTLPEYVSEADRLSGSARVSVDVVNVAPVVSLTSSRMKTADLLFAAVSDEEADEISSARSALQSAFYEKGMSEESETVRMKSGEELNGGSAVDSVFSLRRKYGYGAEADWLEKNWYLCSSDTLYTIDGTWEKNTKISNAHYYTVKAPYTVNAYDLYSGGALLWSVTAGEEQFGASQAKQIVGIACDDKGTYLFLRAADRTLVYDGKTGAYTGALPLAVGEDNYVFDGRIYTVKADGVYKIDLRTGSVRKLYDAAVCMKDHYCDPAGSSKRLNGEIHFVTGKGTRLLQGIFNPRTEAFRFVEMRPSQAQYNSTYTLLGFGTDGKVCIGQDQKKKAYAFDADGKELGVFSGWSTGEEYDVLPVYKSDGTFDYIAAMYNRHYRAYKKENYEMRITLYGVDGEAAEQMPLSYGETRTVSDSARPGSGTDARRAMYAVQTGEDVIVNNGDWATSVSDGSSLKNYYYTCFSQVVFDTEARTGKRYLMNPSAEYQELCANSIYCEYGKVTDDYVLSVSSRDNAAGAYGEEGNAQVLKVARLPKSEETETAQCIDRFAQKKGVSGTDFAAVVLYGKAADRFSEKDAALEIAEIDGEPYGRLQKSLARADRRLLAVSGGADRATSLAAFAETAGGGSCLHAEADAGGGAVTAEKTYRLQAGQEYFYEFEYAGNEEAPLSVTANSTKEVSESDLLTGSRYSVTRIETEDFDDAARQNPYFSGIQKGRYHGGMYYGAEMLFHDDSRNSERTDITEITFEVEEGCTAILQFDYNVSAQDKAVDEVVFTVNGERWQRNVNITPNSGTYTHPTVLPEGRNTITMRARMYGTRPQNIWATVDNLRVLYLEKTDGADAAGQTEEPVSAKGNANGASQDAAAPKFRTVSGSFRTPEKIMTYEGQRVDYYRLPAAEMPQDMVTVTASGRYRTLTVTIPEGKQAIYTGVLLKSTATDSPGVPWSFAGSRFKVSKNNTRAGFGTQVPGSFWAYTLVRQGVITASAGELRYSSAGFGEVETMLTDELFAPVEQGKYFLDPQSEILYFANETYDGSVNVRISGQDAWNLRNFKLYRMENGRRIYEEDGSLRADGWNATGGSVSVASVTDGDTVAEDAPLIYQKGEEIKYNVLYSDYENDPSKAQYWRYTHTPANDGLHPEAGKVLSAPIERFYVDGKYEVEHWQEDSTGKVTYDKLSNIAALTFYIEGGASAPWITEISTVPQAVRTDAEFRLKIGVDDLEKDILSLTTEIYDPDRRLICADRKEGLTAGANGRYPVVYTEGITVPEPGRYRAVCTVRDETGAGVREYVFDIEASEGIKGSVRHFPAWEERRLAYNKANPDHPRSSETFFPAEAFRLTADVQGAPTSVTAAVQEYPSKKAVLAKETGGSSGSAGSMAGGTTDSASGATATYGGKLFDNAMAADLAKKCLSAAGNRVTLHFVFTAQYAGGRSKTDVVPVLVDANGASGPLIHRVF